MSICLIKEMREDKGISRKQLAEAVGCSYHYIATVENQIIRKPSHDRLIKIADFFGVKFWDLYAEDENLEYDYEYSLMQSFKDMYESEVSKSRCESKEESAKYSSESKDSKPSCSGDSKPSYHDDIRARIACAQKSSIEDESSDMVNEESVGSPSKSTNYVPRLHLMDGYDPSIKERIKAVQGPDMASVKRDSESKPKDLLCMAGDPSELSKYSNLSDTSQISKCSQHSVSEDSIDKSVDRIKERIARNQALEKLGHVVVTDEGNPKPKDLVCSASKFHDCGRCDIRFMQEPKSTIKK